MMTNRLKHWITAVTTAALAFVVSSAAVADTVVDRGHWEEQPDQFGGNYVVSRSCANTPSHNFTDGDRWLYGMNVVAQVETYGDCDEGHVSSIGSVSREYIWRSDDPKLYPPPFKVWAKVTVTLDHVADGQPAGSAMSRGDRGELPAYGGVLIPWGDGRRV